MYAFTFRLCIPCVGHCVVPFLLAFLVHSLYFSICNLFVAPFTMMKKITVSGARLAVYHCKMMNFMVSVLI